MRLFLGLGDSRFILRAQFTVCTLAAASPVWWEIVYKFKKDEMKTKKLVAFPYIYKNSSGEGEELNTLLMHTAPFKGSSYATVSCSGESQPSCVTI